MCFLYIVYCIAFDVVCLIQRTLVITTLFVTKDFGGGRVVRWCWVNFQCQGDLLIWIIVRQGPTVLAVGADGVVWTFFLSSIISLFFLPLSGRRPDID